MEAWSATRPTPEPNDPLFRIHWSDLTQNPPLPPIHNPVDAIDSKTVPSDPKAVNYEEAKGQLQLERRQPDPQSAVVVARYHHPQHEQREEEQQPSQTSHSKDGQQRSLSTEPRRPKSNHLEHHHHHHPQDRHHQHHHYQQQSDESEFGTNEESDPEPLLVSLRVCKTCQDSLLTAFEHCLSRHNSNMLESVHQIDEVADCKQLTEPPFFEVVRDPTVATNTVYDELKHKVERDRTVFFQKKYSSGAGRRSTNFSVSDTSTSSARFFSGALYKRSIEAKDREIRHLRERLYDRTVAERLEHGNVEKLRVALNRSMRYYMFAEEWQKSESARLLQDVRYLKAEMSSLMAFLINSEEEKRMLLDQMQDIREQVKQKETKINEVEQQKDQLKSKLHESFKEFLVMNETISRLKKEAEHGSDTIISRNEILQRNLDKVSRDFEKNAQELSASQTRVKELEFELEELVVQFNITGEAKRSAEDHNVKLTSELDAVTRDYKELKSSHESIVQHSKRVEADLRETTHAASVTRRELETKTAEQGSELIKITAVKKEVEASLKYARSEIEKLNSALKSVTRSKDQLESAFRTAVQKSDREIASREDKIAELVEKRAEDAKAIKKVQEQKEQLMFQVTDLQNNLDRELANSNILSFELVQVKRTTEERTTFLEEQVEKLNAAKLNLANDKKQLTDKIRLVRTDLKKKEDEFTELDANFVEHKAAAAVTEESLRKELVTLQDQHRDLVREHKSLEQKQALLIETNVELSMKQEALRKKQVVLEEQEAAVRREIASVKVNNEELTRNHAEAVSERSQMKIHLESVLIKTEELKQIISQERGESSLSVKERDEQIVKLTADLYQVQEEEKRLSSLCRSLKLTVERLEIELSDTKAALEAEALNREQFEMHCYELRQELHKERRLRLEFERMQSRIDKREAERVLEKLEAMRIRDKKLNDLSKAMKVEYNRLKSVSTMLPTEDDLVVIEAPELSKFLAADGTQTHHIHIKNASINPELRPDVKVTVTKLNNT